MSNSPRRVAIACQGGGSFNAFTAGALLTLTEQRPSDVQYVGFSGTSGGGLCATIAWYASLQPDPSREASRLEALWNQNSATQKWDQLWNRSLVKASKISHFLPLPTLSPYSYPEVAHGALKALVERNIPFDQFPSRLQPDQARLYIGAVDVLSGEFKAFANDEHGCEVSAQALLASAALPEIFRSVKVGEGLYWDGLFSQNPPIRELTELAPDELWIIRINPVARDSEPTTMEEIRERKNELSGNLSLQQEIRQIETINGLLASGALKGTHHRPIAIRAIGMDGRYRNRSKLDRSYGLMKELMAHGREQALALV
jgi:NTE family protein